MWQKDCWLYLTVILLVAFFLTVTLPILTKQRRMAPAVFEDIEDLGILLQNTFVEFLSSDNFETQDINNLEKCQSVLTSRNWNDKIKFPIYPEMDTYFTSFRHSVYKIWDNIHEIRVNNKEYLTENQLELLNNMNDKAMGQLLEVTGNRLTILETGADLLTEMYCEMIDYYNQLKVTFKEYRRNPKDKMTPALRKAGKESAEK